MSKEALAYYRRKVEEREEQDAFNESFNGCLALIFFFISLIFISYLTHKNAQVNAEHTTTCQVAHIEHVNR